MAILLAAAVMLYLFPETIRWVADRLDVAGGGVSGPSVRTVLAWIVIGVLSGLIAVVVPSLAILVGLGGIVGDLFQFRNEESLGDEGGDDGA